jgi:hypothetical protein
MASNFSRPPPPPFGCVCVLTLCMGHRVPVVSYGRPPGRSLAARLDLLRLDPVPVGWAAAVLWVCGVVEPLLLAAAGGRCSVLPWSLVYLRGPQWDCMPCVLRPICVCAWAPSGCVRWVAVAAGVVVAGRALPSFFSLGGCRIRRCWSRCWRYTPRGAARALRPLHAPPCLWCPAWLGCRGAPSRCPFGGCGCTTLLCFDLRPSAYATTSLRDGCDACGCPCCIALPIVAVCRVLHPLVAAHASAFCAQWSFASASVTLAAGERDGCVAFRCPVCPHD